MSRGTTLGRYTLIEQLAVGGMAEIWLAHMAGPEGFEKLLVIKKILPHLLQRTSFLKMFLNEARLAAQLNHPNIVQLYDLGKVDESYFIAMEYIFGRDLSEISYKAKQKNIPLPIKYATKIISQVCEGLYYAHTKNDQLGQPLNIVHRDVSPHNILVSFAGNVKILDFGIAKAANQYEQTQQGVLKGKVSYMSPEQIWGEPIDARSDLFGLGAVFYELLTGSRLFTGENDMAILRKITEEEIRPPSFYNPEIPPDLEAIILRTLDKNPKTRYPNAWELQQDLNLLLKRLGSPTNIHMAQFLKELFDDEMEAERRYLQKKIEELVHADMLPPIEEEETLVVFAGSNPLGQVERDLNSEVLELVSEDEISAELPLLMEGSYHLDDEDQTILPLSHDNTSEPMRNPWLDQASYDGSSPPLAAPPDLFPSEAVSAAPPLNPGTPEPFGSPHTQHSSRQPSPLFETIQQFQGHLSPLAKGASGHPPLTSHAEAQRNASYAGPQAPPSSMPSPVAPPALSFVPSFEDEQTFSSETEPAPSTHRRPDRSPPLSLSPSPDTPLFLPMTSEPRRGGDIPVVLSLKPHMYQQLAQQASQRGATVPDLVMDFVLQALKMSGFSSEENEPPCQPDPRSHRLAPIKKD